MVTPPGETMGGVTLAPELGGAVIAGAEVMGGAETTGGAAVMGGAETTGGAEIVAGAEVSGGAAGRWALGAGDWPRRRAIMAEESGTEPFSASPVGVVMTGMLIGSRGGSGFGVGIGWVRTGVGLEG